jgi:ABC-type glucose/galactose transport system permease subunit
VVSGIDFREGQGAVEGLYPGAVILYQLQIAFEHIGIMIAYTDLYEQPFAKY